MTTRREVPFAGDSLGWIHSELAEIKSRLALVQETAEQSRAQAVDASERATQTRLRLDQFEGQDMVILHLQDDLRALREQVARAQDDVHSLRQSREEMERRVLADSERVRQDRNEITHHFAELAQHVEGWQERIVSAEEHNRRAVEGVAQLIMRLETAENARAEADTLAARLMATVSRMDQELQRLAGLLSNVGREDDVHRERINSAFEALRRLESEVDAIETETNRITRLDDRLELVQAERTRHNERLNELGADFARISARLDDQEERVTLVEVRMSNYQDDLRKLGELIQSDREQISGYLHALAEVEADMRKRHIIALEKEIRDIRGRGLHFADE
jgi:chromosome segregation ATPase